MRVSRASPHCCNVARASRRLAIACSAASSTCPTDSIALSIFACVGPFVFGQVRTISRRAHRRSARVRAMVGARRRADRPDVVLPVGVHFSGLRKLSHPPGPPDTTGRLGTPRRQLTGFQNAKPILYGYTVIRPILSDALARRAQRTAVESGKRKGMAARAAACAAARIGQRVAACSAAGMRGSACAGRAAAYFFGCFAARSDFSRSTSAIARSTFSAVR